MKTMPPKLESWLKEANALTEKMLSGGYRATPINTREGLANLTKAFVTKIPDIAWVQDDYICTQHYNLPVRIYHPVPEKALPVVIYFHGGGHMAGSVTVYDPVCRKIAKASGHIVVAVEYRLAPECPYPAGVTDALNAVKYVWPTLDGRGLKYEKTLSIAGDSAGGALAATVSGVTQFDAGISIKKQVLIYPGLDYTTSLPSIDANGTGYVLSKGKILWYYDAYFQNQENRKAASPLHWESTGSLPSTLVISAEFCPLRDENILYVEKLKATGVPVEHTDFAGMVHPFVNLEDLAPEECGRLYETIGDFLKKA